MLHLGLMLLTLTVPAPGLAGDAAPSDDSRLVSVTVDPCVVAERIARQGPCLRREDCGAFDSWQRLFGLPRTQYLEPELADRAPRRFVPGPYLCLAKKRAER